MNHKKKNNKLEEKASIDWNNYLTPEEVRKFLRKDDKVESAENIIYSKEFESRYKDLHNSLQAKYKNSWTKKELVQDLNEFYNFGHLITEDISNKLTLYHNTTNENAVKIDKEGIKVGQRLQAYSKSPEEGNGVWCSTVRGYGYGGATITFEIDEDDEALWKANDTEYMVYRDIKPEEIVDIDLMISKIPCTNNHDITVESDITEGINNWGKEELIRVLGNYPDYFVQPYNKEQLEHLIETGEKYCKGKIKIMESNNKSFKLNKNIKLKLMDILNWYSYEYFYNSYEENEEEKICNSIEDKLIYKQNYNLTLEEKDQLKHIINSYLSDLNHNHRVSKDFTRKINKLTESKQDMIDKYIEENTNSIIGLKELASQVRIYISTVGRKLNKAKYDYERNNYRRQQEFYREILTEINRRLNKTESKQKIEETSRNELLYQAKRQTISRYNRSEGYKGFYIYDIDVSGLFTKESTLLVVCKVGQYHTQLELQDMLYWVQITAEENKDRQINTKNVTKALMNAIDGMDIKVNCECRRFHI